MRQSVNRRDIRRHDLLYLRPQKWEARLRADQNLAGLAQEALVWNWAARGWPLVARRRAPGEADGLPAGLPLPPDHGKRRLFFLLQDEDVAAIASPPLLSEAASAAPMAWRRTLQGLMALAAKYDMRLRVFGSLAWRFLTGLEYLSAQSDLDLLIPLHAEINVEALSHDLVEIESKAPMRLDGEFVRDDGAAVNWREIQLGQETALVKTTDAAYLLEPSLFIEKAHAHE